MASQLHCCVSQWALQLHCGVNHFVSLTLFDAWKNYIWFTVFSFWVKEELVPPFHRSSCEGWGYTVDRLGCNTSNMVGEKNSCNKARTKIHLMSFWTNQNIQYWCWPDSAKTFEDQPDICRQLKTRLTLKMGTNECLPGETHCGHFRLTATFLSNSNGIISLGLWMRKHCLLYCSSFSFSDTISINKTRFCSQRSEKSLTVQHFHSLKGMVCIFKVVFCGTALNNQYLTCSRNSEYLNSIFKPPHLITLLDLNVFRLLECVLKTTLSY